MLPAYRFWWMVALLSLSGILFNLFRMIVDGIFPSGIFLLLCIALLLLSIGGIRHAMRSD